MGSRKCTENTESNAPIASTRSFYGTIWTSVTSMTSRPFASWFRRSLIVTAHSASSTVYGDHFRVGSKIISHSQNQMDTKVFTQRYSPATEVLSRYSYVPMK